MTDHSSTSKLRMVRVDEGGSSTCPTSPVSPTRIKAIAVEIIETTEMNYEDGDLIVNNNGLHVKVALLPTVQKDHKTGFKRKVPNTKKSCIYNYFTRARSGAGESNNLMANETTRTVLLTGPPNITPEFDSSLRLSQMELAPGCTRDAINSTLDTSTIRELLDLVFSAGTARGESNKIHSNLGSPTRCNDYPAELDCGPEETRTDPSVSTFYKLDKGQADPVKKKQMANSGRDSSAGVFTKRENPSTRKPRKHLVLLYPSTRHKGSTSASFLALELDSWAFQEPSVETPESGNETRGRHEESKGGEKPAK
ncbi:hypothetical protein NDU88_001625 [Pleurodeles waltl]|uniref:Uncharacterized protein n=1 Tax=Pleurodeles waltl TaxID=8319 RepID=A0AAV7TIB7_PLEWA|nr:hypothetical protein NDU88_001625 [Pleurodeles waltl]